MSGVNGKAPETDISGPSVLQIAAERAGVDLRAPVEQLPDAQASEAPKSIARNCHAVGCRSSTEAGCLFCKPHWLALPHATRRRMMFYVTRGQWNDVRKCRPEWLKEAREAVQALLGLEFKQLVMRVFGNLPEGYDPAQLKVTRYGFAAMVIEQPGKSALIASLDTGEVRELVKPAAPTAANDDAALAEKKAEAGKLLQEKPVPTEGRMLAPTDADDGDSPDPAQPLEQDP